MNLNSKSELTDSNELVPLPRFQGGKYHKNKRTVSFVKPPSESEEENIHIIKSRTILILQLALKNIKGIPLEEKALYEKLLNDKNLSEKYLSPLCKIFSLYSTKKISPVTKKLKRA